MKTKDALTVPPKNPGKTSGPPQPPKLDYETYRADLAEFELTTQQENELLEVLWQIARTLVDIGFGLDPVQQVIPALTKNALSKDAQNVVFIEDHFNRQAEETSEDE